jgi:hypothetical protein
MAFNLIMTARGKRVEAEAPVLPAAALVPAYGD